jgi:RimJ/RimL family protein N-acetyltransferase
MENKYQKSSPNAFPRYLEAIWEYQLYLWLPKSAIDEVVAYSNSKEDLALLLNTSDAKRFVTKEKLQTWLSDTSRYIFSLLTPEWNIVWIWWARPCDPPIMNEITEITLYEMMMNHSQDICTGGIRIYPPYRGKWVALSLVVEGTKHFRKLFPETYMCIDIDEENIASQKTYARAGYIHIGYGENQKTVEAQVHPRRVYLEVPN